MLHKLKILLYAFCYFSGIVGIFYYFTKRNQLILTYHNVLSDEDFDHSLHLGVSCNASAFSRQINIVKKYFTVTTELGKPGSCVITFDDGFKNNVTVAEKLLANEDIKAIIFVPLKNFQQQKTLWVDEVIKWLSYVPVGNYQLLGEDYCIKNESNRRGLWQAIWDSCKSNKNLQDCIVDQLNSQYPFSELEISASLLKNRFSMLNKNDIDRLKSRGHKIGCHSVSHHILSSLDEEQLKSDFSVCEKEIDRLYNTNIYSYPFGGKDEVSSVVVERCKESRFSAGLMNYRCTPSQYSLPRISLPNTKNKYEIHAYLSGLKYFLDDMRQGFKAA